jgi:flagellar hook-basal body complex protein FliE
VIAPIPPIGPLGSGTAAGAGAPASASGFSNAVTNALDQVQSVQNSASAAEAQAAAGQGSVASAMVAATQASLATQVTVALTNRAISAFTDVMNLQI